MLSRIANNLFWAGRYIERAEHTARYLQVNYFSALDAPISVQRNFVLDSILRMNGYNQITPLEEGQVLLTVALSDENPNSIIQTIRNARQNTRGSRDILSSELWEAINKTYHFVTNYNVEQFKHTHLFDFTQSLTELVSSIKGKIDSTLLHNEAWAMIKLGLYIERAYQILNAILTKLDDIEHLRDTGDAPSMVSYQLATLLRGLEAFDMSRQHYKRALTGTDALEFLLFNEQFPRSVLACLSKIENQLSLLNEGSSAKQDSSEFLAGKFYCELKYMTIDEVEANLRGYLQQARDHIFVLCEKVDEEYFTH